MMSHNSNTSFLKKNTCLLHISVLEMSTLEDELENVRGLHPVVLGTAWLFTNQQRYTDINVQIISVLA
jgi:hypothetical protein